jgi:AcrR family transcriptional regulator
MQTAKGQRPRGRPAKNDDPADSSKAEQIRDAALKIFARDGFAAASLRPIAAEAGVHVALIGHNYGSKLQLWRAVIDYVAERLVTGIRSISAEEPSEQSSGVGLPQVISQLVDVVCDTPFLAQFMLKEVSQQDERFEYIYERLVKPMHDLLLPAFQVVQSSSDERRFDPEYALLVFTGSIAMVVASRAFLVRFSMSANDEEAFRDELKHTLIAGFGNLRRSSRD